MLRDLFVRRGVNTMRKELNKVQRALSIRKRLSVDMGGFKSSYEEL